MPVSSGGPSPTPSSPEPLDHHPARSWTRSVSWLVMADDRFLRALRRERVDRTPVWFMRQAGRYLPEYRELRGDRDILESIRRPEEAVEITMQPLRRMPHDAPVGREAARRGDLFQRHRGPAGGGRTADPDRSGARSGPGGADPRRRRS